MKTPTKILTALVLIPIWIYFISPILLRIPSNFSYKADVISVDNFYDQETKDFKGEQYSKTDFYYEVVGKHGFDLDIKNVFNVQTLDGDPVFKAEPVYRINSITGRHVASDDKNREGYLFAPRNLKKGEGFTYWHVTSPEPLHMKYAGEEYLYGLKVYKYEKSDLKPYDQTEFLTFLPDVGVTKGVKLVSNVYMWVEPTSGYLVKIEDFSTDYYYYDLKTEQKLHPHNQFINTYSESSTKKNTEIASAQRIKVLFILYGVPIIYLLYVFLRLVLTAEDTNKIVSFIKTFFIPILVFSIFIFISNFLARNARQSRNSFFSDKARQTTLLINKELNSYANLVSGGKGLFDASNSVSSDEWAAYVESLDLENNYPGVLGLGFAKSFTRGEISQVESEAISNGLNGFKVFPIDDRQDYTSIIYLEPQNERNLTALGYDMHTDETRRIAMDRAVETGTPTMSGKVTLLQEIDDDKQPGFLIYAPVFKNDKLIGYSYSPFRTEDLINSLFPKGSLGIQIRIFDGLKTNQEHLMYDRAENVGKSQASETLYRRVDTIYVANHAWTLEYSNPSDYVDGLINRISPYVALIIGLFISGMSGFIIYTIRSSEKRAVEYAHTLNQELENNKRYLEVQNSQLQEKIKESQSMTNLMVSRENKMIEMKKELERIKGEK